MTVSEQEGVTTLTRRGAEGAVILRSGALALPAPASTLHHTALRVMLPHGHARTAVACLVVASLLIEVVKRASRDLNPLHLDSPLLLPFHHQHAWEDPHSLDLHMLPGREHRHGLWVWGSGLKV